MSFLPFSGACDEADAVELRYDERRGPGDRGPARAHRAEPRVMSTGCCCAIFIFCALNTLLYAALASALG